MPVLTKPRIGESKQNRDGQCLIDGVPNDVETEELLADDERLRLAIQKSAILSEISKLLDEISENGNENIGYRSFGRLISVRSFMRALLFVDRRANGRGCIRLNVSDNKVGSVLKLWALATTRVKNDKDKGTTEWQKVTKEFLNEKMHLG